MIPNKVWRRAGGNIEAVAGTVDVDSFEEHGPEVRERFRATYLIRSDGSHPHVHGANFGVRGDTYLKSGGWSGLARPCGRWQAGGAYWLFTLGLIGTGMFAVPVLAGSCAYVVAEAAKWRSASLNLKPGLAGKFYVVIGISILVGLAFDFAGLNAVKDAFLVGDTERSIGAPSGGNGCSPYER